MHADNIVWHKQTFREPMWKKQSSSAKLCESKTSWKVKEKEIVPKDSKYLRPLLLYNWFWLGSCAPARVKLRKMEIWSMTQKWNFGRLLRCGDFSVECHFAKVSYSSINTTLAAIAKIVSEDKRKSFGKWGLEQSTHLRANQNLIPWNWNQQTRKRK